MSELIKITQNNGNVAVSAKELYNYLSIDDGSNFSKWAKKNIEDLFVQDVDYQILRLGYENAGRPLTDYALTLDVSKHVAMMSRCDNGFKARQYFIDYEKQQRSLLPTNYKDALKALISEIEEREQAQAKVAELTPKADFYDTVASSESTIDIGEVAKVLNFKNIGRNKLFRLLRELHVLKSDNIPYQKYIDLGYFKVIESSVFIKDAPNVCLKTVVFQKGVDYINRVVKETYELNKTLSLQR